ncbi:MAG: protein kinase [Bacteroidales bacterium]|nr:protein kinase [Bacteroidales bacterium]
MQYDKLGDEYLLLKELGEGGYATVYKAKNVKYGYIRAIRVLNAHVEKESDKIYQSFLHECRLLLRLGNGCHNNIVRMYQPRHVAGRAFVEMDWVDGIDLRKLIEQYGGKVPIDETLRMLREIGSALAYCHHDIYKVCYDRESDNLDDADDGSPLITSEVERCLIEKYRVIHNDIHTGNIMRRSDGTYILLDFGLAVDGNTDVVGSSRKKQGAIEFKSPERSKGLDPTPQDDIYSFGCVLYAMLTGRPPFPVRSDAKVLSDEEIFRVFKAHRDDQPPVIHRDDAPKWLVDMTMRCLAKNPADRYADGYELYQEVLGNMKQASQVPASVVAPVTVPVHEPAPAVAPVTVPVHKPDTIVSPSTIDELNDLKKRIVRLEKDKRALTRNLEDLFSQLKKSKAKESELLVALKEKNDRVNVLTESVINLKSKISILQRELDMLKRRSNPPANGNRTAWK